MTRAPPRGSRRSSTSPCGSSVAGDDGLHLLDSEFVLLELADRLLLLPGCSGLRVERGRAIRRCRSTRRTSPGAASSPVWRPEPELACLSLEKRIPARAGLGGGSSDAAAAWRLGRAWRGLDDVASPADLDALSTIGADVPFFASGLAAARVSGIGERVEADGSARLRHVVLVAPGLRALDRGRLRRARRADEWGRLPERPAGSGRCGCGPSWTALMDAVAAAGGDPRLTGSGPTIFSMTDDAERASRGRRDARGRRASRATMTRTRLTPATIEITTATTRRMHDQPRADQHRRGSVRRRGTVQPGDPRRATSSSRPGSSASIRPTGELVGSDVAGQAERALANLAAILEAAGSGLDRLVKVTVFLADIDDWPAVNEVYARVVPQPFPARSAFAVRDLPKGARVEIEAVAAVGGG